MFRYLLEEGGVVFALIVFSGAAAFLVYIERSLHLHRARIRADDFLKGIFNILRRKNIAESLAICEETPGPVAYLVKTAILHRNETVELLRTALDDASLAEISRMERRLVVIAMVGQIAPLLGLLGTILGLLRSMLVLQQQAPLIQSADILGGLRAALIVTAAGLMVAIPCYVMFNLLVIKIDRIVLDMERAASEIVVFLKGTGDAQEGMGER